MKRTVILFASLLGIASCQKHSCENPQPATTVNPLTQAKGGSGGGGGGTTTTGAIQSLFAPNGNRIIATKADSILVVLSAAAPAGGRVVSMSSSDAAIQLPATVTVPAGAISKYVPYTTTATISAHNVTITATANGQSKSVTAKFFPLTASIAAPSLQSPGNGSSFGYHRQVIFDWSDLSEAFYYEIQVSSTTSFTTLSFNSGPLVSTTVGDYFDGPGTRYWRVRGVDASDNGGTWSAVRSFVVKPQ